MNSVHDSIESYSIFLPLELHFNCNVFQDCGIRYNMLKRDCTSNLTVTYLFSSEFKIKIYFRDVVVAEYTCRERYPNSTNQTNSIIIILRQKPSIRVNPTRLAAKQLKKMKKRRKKRAKLVGRVRYRNGYMILLCKAFKLQTNVSLFSKNRF